MAGELPSSEEHCCTLGIVSSGVAGGELIALCKVLGGVDEHQVADEVFSGVR